MRDSNVAMETDDNLKDDKLDEDEDLGFGEGKVYNY